MTTNQIVDSSVTAIINAPIEKIDIPTWCFNLSETEYQGCSPAHIAAGFTTAPDGKRMSINVETIGGRMIEVHLRMSDQWPDLYGAGWVDALVRLYQERRWDFADRDRRDGYSVVLFGPHGPRYRHPPPALVAQVRRLPGVSSVQITFHEDKEPERHAMPPGGFRLAVVNAFDLDAGRAAREMLRTHFLARAA